MSEFDDSLPHDGSDADPTPEVPPTPQAPEDSDQVTVTRAVAGKRKRVREPKKKRSLARRITYWIIGLITLALLSYGGFYGYILWRVEHNITKSSAIGTHKGLDDVLIMGLDSRLDEKGNKLPARIYDALHAGGGEDGGNNANVLMYIHTPKDGSRATAISIPRDDWVDIPGCKSDVAGLPSSSRMRHYVGSGCKGKIKSAYGWALAAAQDEGKSWQQAKDIARLAEIMTVEKFLNVKITNFVEVTMVAFFQMAEKVGRIEVCVKADTQDSYSGADFKAGHQTIDAKQAVAFVRQRRDLHERYDFTDLDRSRRQQAFLIGLLEKLKSAGTLLQPFTLNAIVGVAEDNVVLSKGLDVIEAAKFAANLSGGKLHFYTLPVVAFSKFQASPGQPFEEANEVDVPQTQAIVQSLINPKAVTPSPTPTPTPTATATPLPMGTGYTVNVANASTVSHKASDVIKDLAAKFQYTQGQATTASSAQTATTIEYNPADKAAAETLAKRFNGAVTLTAKNSVAARTFKVTLGSTLAKSDNTIVSATDNPSSTPTNTTSPSTLPSAVSATGGGLNGPAITDLTDLSGGGIPCVK